MQHNKGMINLAQNTLDIQKLYYNIVYQIYDKNILLTILFPEVKLTDALKETFEAMSKILDEEPLTLSESSESFLNCSEFLLMIDEFKQIYISTLQIDSLARGFEDNGHGEKFTPEPAILEKIESSTKYIRNLNKLNLRIAKEITDDGSECPSNVQLEEARQLIGKFNQ